MGVRTTVETYGQRADAIPAPVTLVAAIVSFQVGAALATHLFAAAGVEGAVFLRSSIGALLLLAITRPTIRGRSRSDLLLLVVLGGLLATMNSAFYQAVDRLPLGIAVTVEFIGPLGVAVAASRRRVDVLWVVLAATGIALFAGAPSGSSVTAAGLAFALIAAAAWAGYILAAQRVGTRWPGFAGLAVGLSVSALLLAPIGGVDGISAMTTSASFVAIAVGVAVFSTALPYTLELAALRRMPARVYGVVASLEPVAGALVGLVVLGQTLSGWEALAAVFVVTASVGAARSATGTPEIAPN
jgi:inner membrane transporter RhtA